MSDETDPVTPAGFDLPTNADIRAVGEIVEQCRSALEATGDVRVGCAGVERLDAAVVQCLIALHDGLHQAGRALELVDPSAACVRAVEALGLVDMLLVDPRLIGAA